MKVRTDFVTNSSSSSFVLVLRIGLTNGEVLRFMGTGDPEGYAQYSEINAIMSPRDIANSRNIAELIDKLKHSVDVLNDHSSVIVQLKKLSSMDEIEKITINGDKYGRNGQHQYAHYTYHRSADMTAYDAGGDDYVYEEGSGGSLCFYEKDLVKGKNFGENSVCSGYRTYKGLYAYDQDVEFDPDALAQEVQRIEKLKAAYSQIRKKYLEMIEMFTYTTEEIVFFEKNFFGYNVPAAVRYALGGYITYDPSKTDYYVAETDVIDADLLPVNVLDTNSSILQSQVEVLEHFLSVTASSSVRFIKCRDLRRAITLQRNNGYPAIKERFDTWKASIPFDHLSTLDCKNKKFAFSGLTKPQLLDIVMASCAKANWNLSSNELVVRNGGTVLSHVTLQCDYLIVGLSANMNSRAVKTAIQYRDSGKSQIKIIPEDELLRMLNGETLEVSGEYLQSVREREDALQKAREEKNKLTMEKLRLHEKLVLQQAAEKAARQKAAEEEKIALTLKRQQMKEQMEKEKQQLQAAEKALREEKKLAAEEERQRKLQTDVLYRPSEEPANIRTRMDRLFAKLDEAYPDKQITGLQKDHKKWAETITELYRLLGYPDNRSFLEAYGYTVVQGENKGGRPTNDHTAVIEELKRRYPNGGCKNVAELKAANSDLPIKTLVNNAQKLFGMSLKEYLTQIGVLP